MSRTIGTRFSAPRLFGGLAVLSAGLFLAGCGGDGGGDIVGAGEDSSSSFTVTISGDVSLTGSGDKAISQAAGGNWAVSMFSSKIDINIMRGSGRPGPGTYAVTGSGADGVYNDGETGADVQVNSGDFVFSGESVSGTLTVDSSSANRVSGSFTFVVEDFLSELKITVTGTFEAVHYGG